MARIKLQLPEFFLFATQIPVRITDINYGGHVGNDALLSLIHEARVQYLASFNYSEMNVAGVSLIMGDVAIEFKSEAFYGDTIEAQVTASEFSRVGFDIYYKLTKKEGQIVAVAKTGMVCFDYTSRKVTSVPAEALTKLKCG